MIRLSTASMNRILSAQGFTTSTIQIYAGEIPTVDTAYVYAPANYTPLATALNVKINVVDFTMSLGLTTGVKFRGLTAGTATWFAMYYGPTPASAVLGTITNDAAVPAVMLLDNVNIVPTETTEFTIVDLGIRVAP